MCVCVSVCIYGEQGAREEEVVITQPHTSVLLCARIPTGVRLRNFKSSELIRAVLCILIAELFDPFLYSTQPV